MSKQVDQLTALSLYLIEDILKDVGTDLGAHGGTQDIPTARYNLTRARLQLSRLRLIIEERPEETKAPRESRWDVGPKRRANCAACRQERMANDVYCVDCSPLLTDERVDVGGFPLK